MGVRKLPYKDSPVEAKLEAVTEEANKRLHKKFPLLEHPIKTWMAQVILEVTEELNQEGSHAKG